MSKFRKKPVEIEARQLIDSPGDWHDVYQWIEANTQGSFEPYADEIPASGVSIDPATGFMLIATLEGVMQAKPGRLDHQRCSGRVLPVQARHLRGDLRGGESR